MTELNCKINSYILNFSPNPALNKWVLTNQFKDVSVDSTLLMAK